MFFHHLTNVIQAFVLVWSQWRRRVVVELGAFREDVVVDESDDCLLDSFEQDHLQHLIIHIILLQFALIKGKMY
jgi:hypothetical protein